MTAATVPTMPPQAQTIVYDWLALDIETANGRPEDAERWARLYWSPSATWKDETIGRRWHEAIEKKTARLALLDSSPILCVSLRSAVELRCLHWLHRERGEPTLLHGAMVEGFEDESNMLVALRSLLDIHTADGETTIVGHNVRAFDLPRLRAAYVRAGLQLPAALARRDLQVYDTMVEYVRRFSIHGQAMISLDDVLEVFGMESHKCTMSGAIVPELYDKGAFDTIIQYALLDVIAESDLFLRMAGLTGR
jgi:hypothetical protein